MRKIAFNCNQTKKQGLGHFFRCLNLAKHMSILRNCNIYFLGEFSSFSNKILNELGFKIIKVNSKKAIESYIDDFDILITDRYDIDQDYLNFLANNKEIKKVFIDDFNVLDFTQQDLVINFRVGASAFNYNSKDYALGPEYFIYTPILSKIRMNYKFRNDVNLVLFYGTSTNQSNSFFMKLPQYLIKTYKNINVIHLTNHLSFFKHKRYKTINLNPDIEKHFETADIIINGGGLIKYEAAFCGIPSATLSTTIEQHEDTLVLEKENLLYNLGCQTNTEKINLEEKLNCFIQDSVLRQSLYEEGRKFFKPRSITNLINKINEL